MSIGLLRIELRRTAALLLVLPLSLLAWQTLGGWFVRPVVLWPDLSFVIGKGATLIGPPLAGAAAWMAGRERRRGLTELLDTTPHLPFARLLVTLSGTLAWGVVAYSAFTIGALLWTARRATWGGPDLWPIAVGFLALGTYATCGFLLGTLLPGRLTAPLVALALFAMQIGVLRLANTFPSLYPLQWLFSFTYIDTTVWFGGRPAVAPFQALFSVGLTILALVGLAYHRGCPYPRRSAAAVVLALALIMVSVAGVLQRAPTFAALRNYWYPDLPSRAVYTPVCSAAPLPVCVHPAYAAALPQASTDLNALLTPLIGLPGFPTRAMQSAPSNINRLAQGDQLSYALDSYNTYDARTTALYCAVYACPSNMFGPIGASAPGDPARAVIAAWLWARVEGPGFSRFGSCGTGKFMNDICAAAGRFAALPTAAQHAWLVAHFADLRAGRLALGDLP